MIQKNRNSALDVLKGIGIITMIMGHSNMGSLFESYIVGFHMQLFFLVSGYLFRPLKYNRSVDYMRRKISTIIVPYIFFAVCTIVTCEILNFIYGDIIYSRSDYFRGIIWGNRAIFPITGAIWFLQSIFWIEIGYYYIQKISSKTWKSVLIVFIMIISALLSYNNIHLPFSLDSALSGIVFYHIGFLLFDSRLFERYDILRKPKFVFWVVVLIINSITILLNSPVNPRTCQFSIFPLYYINAIVGTWVWFIVSRQLTLSNSSILKRFSIAIKYVGKNSIVYLGYNQLMICGLYILLSSILPVQLGIVRAFRNILIALITVAACSGLAVLFNSSFLCIFIGKKR